MGMNVNRGTFWIIIILFAGLLSGASFFTQKKIKTYRVEQKEIIKMQEIKQKVSDAKIKSQNVKAVYMTHTIATDKGASAKQKRDAIIKLVDDKIINSVVIDIKENNGTTLDDATKNFVSVLKEKDAWVIARMVLFADASQKEKHTDWYLKNNGGTIWLNNRGIAWLDPTKKEVLDYLSSVGALAANAGFDELQFDYVRFPSDGNMATLIYPETAQTTEGRINTINDFTKNIAAEIKKQKPDMIISADVFGYITLLGSDSIIGQDFLGIGKSFDYISPMVYPSHYYSGFFSKANPELNLPAVSYGYMVAKEKDVVAHPYEVVYRSLVFASTTLASASSTVALRPWLQDFTLPKDRARGIGYTLEDVKKQIKAAEDSGASGWMLWNASNDYSFGK